MFADEIAENAWMRADAACECERVRHGHRARCCLPLVWQHRGALEALGGWELLRSGDPPPGRVGSGQPGRGAVCPCYDKRMADRVTARSAKADQMVERRH